MNHEEKLKKLEEREAILQIKKKAIFDEYDEKFRPLREALEKLEKELDAKIEPIDKEMSEIQREIRQIKEEMKNEQKKQEYEKFMETGEITEGAVQYMLKIRNPVKTDIRGGKLPNGIQIAKIEGYYDDMRYFAFYKNKLIGMWTRRRAEHQGDETVPYSCVVLDSTKIPTTQIYEETVMQSLYVLEEDFRGMKAGEVLTQEQYEQYCYKNGYRIIARKMRFNDWKRHLKSLTKEQLEKAKGIDVDDPQNRHFLTDWGWMW